MKRNRPILLIVDSNVVPSHIEAVEQGIHSILMVAGIKLRILKLSEPETLNLLNSEKRTEGETTSQMLVCSSCNNGSDPSRHGKINAETLLTLCGLTLWVEEINPYFVFLTATGLHSRVYHSVPIWYLELFGTAVSSYLLNGTKEPLKSHCLTTFVLHALGHTFGLIPEKRTESVEQHFGLHCANRCVMRPLEYYEDRTRDRLSGDAFCPICTNNLREFFTLE